MRDRDAALLLDCLHPSGAIRSRPRQDDAHRAAPIRVGKRGEKGIDDGVHAARTLVPNDAQVAVGERHHGAGRQHVQVVRLHGDPIAGGDDRHARGAAQDFRKPAFLGRIEMLYEHVRQSRVALEIADETGHGLEPTSRRADADNGLRRRGCCGLRLRGDGGRHASPVLTVDSSIPTACIGTVVSRAATRTSLTP